jgi:TorA maturation chaperone TorD
MRDPGLTEAIRAVGGASALARQLGISQPSVSNWIRIPAERVISVESITGIDRAVLRPDLYGKKKNLPADAEIDEVDIARSQHYTLLALLLGRAPNQTLLDNLAAMRSEATPLGVALAGLAQAASDTTAERAEREYFDLFIGIGRGELMPYGSYYQTGFVYERPLARLRGDLAEIGIARADDVYEPEDHAAILCEIMSGIVSGRLPAPADSDRAIFENHVAPWIGRFFVDLESAESSKFYRPVGTLGRVFIDIETEAFALSVSGQGE